MSSNFLRNISTCICIKKKYKNGEFSTFDFWRNLACTIVQGLLPEFGVTLKNCKKSKLDRNELKLSTQHKYMYMHKEKI